MTLAKLFSIAARKNFVVNNLFHLQSEIIGAYVSGQYGGQHALDPKFGYAQGPTPAKALERALIVAICRNIKDGREPPIVGVNHDAPHTLKLEQLL